jgi:hypothetical protein
MRRRHIRTVVAALALALAACGQAAEDKHEIIEPATVEPIEGSDVSQVTLTQRAVERLGIETSAVADQGEHLSVPSGALWLDVAGVFWVYTNPAPQVFVRHAVELEDDDGERALLSAGPEPGTPVVIVGVPELFGAEVGVGK